MRSTLFHIPTQLTLGEWSVPLFGFGLLFVAWAVVGGGLLLRTALRQGMPGAVAMLGLPLAIAGGMIVWGLPALDDGAGVPVRGYGVMLLLAAAAGTWLSIVRGRRLGIDADTILALGM
jgi:phosphatidylglycerol:prolipoprotein diacylglycerol transferase